MDNYLYDGVCVLSSIVQENQVFAIIQFGLTALMILIGIAYKIWKWWKDAKADGKITKEEFKNIVEDITPDIIDLTETINDFKNDDSDNAK